MNKKLASPLVIVLLLIGVILLRPCAAIVLLTDEQALKEMFPDADNVTTECKLLSVEQLEKVKSQLGGKWVLYQAGSKSKEVGEEDSCLFYFAMENGKKIGVAIMETQPGKWGPVKYIIALDMTGKVKDLAVMMYVEQRGKPIARRSFLGQFIGKTSEDEIIVGKDVDAITGATISSRATAFAVKKVVALYETVYLNE